VGGVARPRRFAQPGVERGATDPRRPDVACLPGMLPSARLLLFSLFCRLRVYFSRHDAHWSPSVGGKSWSSAPATGTALSTR
jgi:hypothetical protein